MTTSDLLVRYEPRGAARELFSAREGEVLLDGPAGTGKSVAALWRLHTACLKYPRIRCLIVRKTGVSLTSTTLVTFESKVAAEALATGLVKWYGGSQREAAAYRYANGSRIVVGGMDKPDKVMSSEYDLVFADEATELTVEDWEKLGTRLRNGRLPWQQQIAACNPGPPTHWLNQRAIEGKMRRLISRHADNPRYVNADGTPTEEGRTYLARLDGLTGVRRLRLRDGIWAAAEGMIYEDFDPAIHVIDPFPIPADWPRFWTVDFGFVHPFVLQCWAKDPDGRLYLYREIYRTRRLVEDHAKQILSLVTDERGQWTEPRPQAVICDHDAEDRATLQRHLGMGTIAADKRVSVGIQAVQRRLRTEGDGRPRLMILRDALVERDPELAEARKPTCTAEEFGGYVWAVKPGGALKEEPVKEMDDGMDALRYMVAKADFRPKTRVTFVRG